MGNVPPSAYCNVTEPFASLPICCAGGKGTVLGGGRPFPGIDEFSRGGLAILYLVFLLWTFVGVALAADVFMSAIEEITSQESTVTTQSKDGKIRRFRARVWNPTVANLTLMALGSSAPEILLSLIELLFGEMYSGDLGPSTIVGSAAFNLLVIIAVCVVAIPATDCRRIATPRVYVVTAFFSVFAYLWLVIILQGTSPDIINLPEAILTFAFFPLLVLVAFCADKVSTSDEWRAAHPMLASLFCLGKGSEAAGRSSGSLESIPVRASVLLSLKAPDGSPASKEDVLAALRILKRQAAATGVKEEEMLNELYKELQKGPQAPRSRAYYRVNAVRKLTGQTVLSAPSLVAKELSLFRKKGTNSPEGAEMGLAGGAALGTAAAVRGQASGAPACTLGFAADHYAVIEGGGSIVVQVRRTGSTSGAVTVDYATKDITATAGSDYVEARGSLSFAAGQEAQTITVAVLDDDVVETDETFSIALLAVTSGDAAISSTLGSTTVEIVNDDFPGMLVLPCEDFHIHEGEQKVRISVERVRGCSGAISCQFATKDGTALAGHNYTAQSGKLEWASGDVEPKVIEVVVTDDELLQGKQYFDVVISDATGGACFDANTDGKREASFARVTIEDDEKMQTLAERAVTLLGVSHQVARLGSQTWKEQFADAIAIGLEGDGEDAAPLSALSKAMTYFFYVVSLPWKLLVACVPPTIFCGGWLCFCVSIVVIGAMTALIGDLANLLGCALGIENSVVAITLVALGTSLPDTFASRAAALGDETADAAIGNVTGSNSVNVFLGLGLSWMVGALWWTLTPATEKWVARYPLVAQRYGVVVGGPVPGLAVPAGDLGFSVTVFVICSVACLCSISLRARFAGGELGAKLRWPTALFFVSLWFLYVLLSTLKAYKVL